MARRVAPPDSLELLLDTICNMFGGVLFLAILMAVLIRSAGQATESKVDASATVVAAAELETLRDELAILTAERDSKSDVARKQRALMQQFVDPQAAAALAELSKLETKQQTLESDCVEAAQDLGEVRARVEDLQRSLATLDKDLTITETQLDEARRALEKEIKARTHSASLPQLRASTKQSIGFILRFGRLYLWHDYDAFGRRTGINAADMAVLGEEDGVAVVAPKPFAGAVVPPDGAEPTAVIQKLSPFSAQRHFISIVVYDDSFAHFASLKKVLLELKYEYHLLPSAPGNEIIDFGDTDALVQ